MSIETLRAEYDAAVQRLENFGIRITTLRVHELASGEGDPPTPEEARELALLALMDQANGHLVDEQLRQIRHMQKQINAKAEALL